MSANESFKITNAFHTDENKRKLLMRRGVYTYEYIDSWDKFDLHEFPPKEKFYSKLNDTHISDEDKRKSLMRKRCLPI